FGLCSCSADKKSTSNSTPAKAWGVSEVEIVTTKETSSLSRYNQKSQLQLSLTDKIKFHFEPIAGLKLKINTRCERAQGEYYSYTDERDLRSEEVIHSLMPVELLFPAREVGALAN